MYIHFQEWTTGELVRELEQNGLPHDGRIIKAFATDVDPRAALDAPALTVVDGNAYPFIHCHRFDYPERGATFSGADLEARIADEGLSRLAARTVRALYRFSREVGLSHTAMTATTEEGWLIDHPFDAVDGIERAKINPVRETAIHLDFFFPDVVASLRQVVDYDDPMSVLDMHTGIHFVNGVAEGLL